MKKNGKSKEKEEQEGDIRKEENRRKKELIKMNANRERRNRVEKEVKK